MKFCVQYNIFCVTETNADNCFNGIQTAIDAITTGWENAHNKNSNNKGLDGMENKWRVSGIQRMSDIAEKNTLINKIKALGSPPFITGRVYAHQCTHMSWKCNSCGYGWDSKDLQPSICPNCGATDWVDHGDGILKQNIISDAKPCVVEEEWLL